MTAVHCMPACFIYRALCTAGTAEILIRRKFPAATSTEYLLFCLIWVSPRRFRRLVPQLTQNVSSGSNSDRSWCKTPFVRRLKRQRSDRPAVRKAVHMVAQQAFGRQPFPFYRDASATAQQEGHGEPHCQNGKHTQHVLVMVWCMINDCQISLIQVR